MFIPCYEKMKTNKSFETMQKLNFIISLCLSCYLIISSIPEAKAQKGLFVKFSVGPGYTTEYSNLNKSLFSIVTINHTIGWGITDDFAVQAGKFGGLNKGQTGDYNYINLDAFGIGFSYSLPMDIKISVLGAYSKVSFAKEWTEPFGSDGGNGLGINMSIDKEWFVAKRWGIRAGPQVFWINTTETSYNFLSVSLNGTVVFYLKPVR
jgi:hypothetical protein